MNEHNRDMLSNFIDPLFTIYALDIVPKHVSASTVSKVVHRSQMETGDWHVSLKLRSKQYI